MQFAPYPFQIWISFPILKMIISLPQLMYHSLFFKEITNHDLFASHCHLGRGEILFFCLISEMGKPRLRGGLLAKARTQKYMLN